MNNIYNDKPSEYANLLTAELGRTNKVKSSDCGIRKRIMKYEEKMTMGRNDGQCSSTIKGSNFSPGINPKTI